MNSRFARGRGYRPYFFFRRNGRTIPAGGRGGGGTNYSYNQRAQRPRGRGGRYFKNGATNAINGIAAQSLDCNFLRPEHYVIPEDGLQVQSIAIDTPLQCPGWRLYFPKERFEETCELMKHIKGVEKHITDHPAHYDLKDIQNRCFFRLQSQVVLSDTSLMTIWPCLLQDLQTFPMRTLATFGAAMYSIVSLAAIDATFSLQSCTRDVYVVRNSRPKKIYARPIGFVDVSLMSSISNIMLDKLFCVRGTVEAIGKVTTAANWIAYKCPHCKTEQALKQKGFHISHPFTCKREGCLSKKGFIELRSSAFTRINRVQIIRVSENQLQAIDDDKEFPETLEIELRHDLVDSIYNGQDVIIFGILKLRPLMEGDEYYRDASTYSNIKSVGSIKAFMKAVSIQQANHVKHSFSDRDLNAISMINAEPDSFKLLVQSLAPTIHGQELAKAGVLLSLFGGAGSQLHDEQEINVLLVGDPGIGKSHILQMSSTITEKGLLIGGKSGCSRSGNQLTATVQGRSNYILDSGALVSSADGHCAIDDIDRFAPQQDTLLQVMQSQCISLSYPCLSATFSVPTTIVATANSIRGHYDRSKLLTENIRINPALLRQFHLVFVLLDKPSKDLDTSFTNHIRALHSGAKKSSTIAARFAMKPKTNDSINASMNDVVDEIDLYDRLKLNALEEEEMDLLPHILMKKFIAYSRQQVKPLLTADAAKIIKDFYMELRIQRNEEKFCAISTSQLEGLIRLAQARARIDFSTEVTKVHVRDVFHIVQHSLANTAVGDYIDLNPATAAAEAAPISQGSMVKKFVQLLQLRSNALGRRVFDFDEIKDMARRAGISCGVTNLVDIVNMQGFLLKKGPNLYEVMTD